jgi:hypothetical protein
VKDDKAKTEIQNKDQRPKTKSHLSMYRRPRFLEVLHAIREEMSHEVDYDVDLFSEMVRSGKRPAQGPERNIRGFKSRAPRAQTPETTVRHRQRKRAG